MYKVRNDFLLVENLDLGSEFSEPGEGRGIYLPKKSQSVFAKFKVLAVGPKVTDVKEGDVVLGERMFQEIDKSRPAIGLIRQEYVHLIES